MTILLEEVFKTSGVPTYTFVQPPEYTKLIVGLRTKGRSIVVEGPSGIGKTTCIQNAIDELGIREKVILLSARKPADIEYINALPEMGDLGIVIIDDFHVLEETIKRKLADFIKTLADEDNERSKIIAIGINKAGDSLIKFATDLNNRIDTVKFEKNPAEKIIELVSKGERTLNIRFSEPQDIAEKAAGSFHITQMLCKEACIASEALNQQENTLDIKISMDSVRNNIIQELDRVFYPVARDFSVGSKLRPEGRAPYFHLLYWLSSSEDWSINLNDMVIEHPKFRGSINQIVEKGFLNSLINSNSSIKSAIHFDQESKDLSVEDPKFLFYIKNILWNKFGRKLGFINLEIMARYDFALSFSGEQRALVEEIFNQLTENELEVFYDKNEQERILSENVEDYLSPIYKSEAEYVIVFLSKEYPKKVWTQFESKQFKERFGDNAIIPIWFSDVGESIFDESRKYGGITYNVDKTMGEQIQNIVKLLLGRLKEAKLTLRAVGT